MVLRLGSNPRTKAMTGELVECWWNGRFGIDHRHDLWLKRFGETWCVESRHSGSGGLRSRDYFSDEMIARGRLASLKSEHGDTWKWVPFG